MIPTTVGTRQFNLRAAAVVLDGSRIFLHQMEGDGFWSLPGGRVEGGETVSSAVVRELKEELAEPVVCGELFMVVENFFTYRGAHHHELGLYFRSALVPNDASIVRVIGAMMPRAGRRVVAQPALYAA